MRSASIAATIGLLLALSARAGDYYVYVVDSASCPWNPSPSTHTSVEVARDLERYFTGSPAEIPAFEAALQNARFSFCSAAERAAFDDALISWVIREPSARRSELYDILFMLGSRRALSELDRLLASGPEPAFRSRLERARASVLKGVEARSR